jgi:hypothetical protein
MAMRKGSGASETFSKFSSSNRLQFQSFKDNDDILVRFVDEHDEWPVVDVHIGVPTKDTPANRKKSNFPWPKNMGATCQNDVMFRIDDPASGNPTDTWEEGFGDCYIHSHYADKMNQWNRPYSAATTSTFARVVLREKRDGKFFDQTEEWESPDGKKFIVPKVRVISQQWGKFFSGIKAAAFEDDSVRTRDFRIQRSGKDFVITAMSVSPDHKPGTESWKTYEEALELMGASLEALIRDQASADWYKKWFIPGPWDDEPLETESAGAATAVAAADSELSPEDQAKMDAMRERLLAGKKS